MYIISNIFVLGCMIFTNYEERFALTGDTLLIRACGRTDFQQGINKIENT